MSVTALLHGILYVLLAYWTIVVAVVEEQQPHGEAVKPGNSDSVVQQTQDLARQSKLTTYGDKFLQLFHELNIQLDSSIAAIHKAVFSHFNHMCVCDFITFLLYIVYSSL